MTDKRPGDPGGFALLIVLWSVVLLALLATGITAAGRTDVQLATNIRRAAAAEAAADAGIAAAIFHAGDAPATAWLADDRPHALPFGAYTLTIHVADEDRKVNLNMAPPELLAALAAAAGVDPVRAAALAQAIAQWHLPNRRAEAAAQYRAAGLPAAPDGGPFRSTADLALVLGMTPPLLARLRPVLSVYADTPLDLAAADPLLQAALRSLGTTDTTPAQARANVLDITSDAQARDGSRFIRHAIVQLGGDETGRPFRTVLWERRSAP